MFKAQDYVGKHATLPEPVPCNIIQVINVSESKEKILEEWRYYHNPNTALFERMEHISRPVIYGVDVDSNETQRVSTAHTTYKLLLRDAHGNYFYGIELEELPFLHPRESTTANPLPIPLGGRVVLQRGTEVRSGIALLRRHQCLYLGVDASSDLARTLNDGVVEKYIDIMEHMLREPS